MPFIVEADFPATIHADILNALTKGDDSVITENAARAVDEVMSYLNGRYDTAVIFNQTGTARNNYIKRIAVTLATYYIYLIHNPRKMHQGMVDEFNRSMETLQGIQSGKINPVGLPVPAPAIDDTPSSGDGTSLQWGGDLQMENNW